MQYKILHVSQLMRHGERTPLLKELYPKDPHKSVYKSLGLGQMTNVSIFQSILICIILTIVTT